MRNVDITFCKVRFYFFISYTATQFYWITEEYRPEFNKNEPTARRKIEEMFRKPESEEVVKNQPTMKNFFKPTLVQPKPPKNNQL